MKKIIATILLVVVAVCAIYYIGTGFMEVSSIVISDFEVSEDGTEMTIKTSNLSSAGFIRKVETNMVGDLLELKFIAAFGGVNGDIGAGDTFVLSLKDNPKYIAIKRGNKTEYILQKDENGEWTFMKE